MGLQRIPRGLGRGRAVPICCSLPPPHNCCGRRQGHEFNAVLNINGFSNQTLKPWHWDFCFAQLILILIPKNFELPAVLYHSRWEFALTSTHPPMELYLYCTLSTFVSNSIPTPEAETESTELNLIREVTKNRDGCLAMMKKN